MKVLIVLTSHEQLGETGLKTGFWLEEFASPYYVFKEHNIETVLASPLGGQPPLDPKSDEADFQTDSTARFHQDNDAKQELANTVRLDSVDSSNFDAVFYPGGHGPLWDLAEDANSVSLIESFYSEKKPIAFVCHAPSVLRDVKDATGKPLVNAKRVTGFSNTEEEAVELTNIVPFSVEDMLKEKGALYAKGADWESYVEIDGLLLTGQNPASSEEVARKLMGILRKS